MKTFNLSNIQYITKSQSLNILLKYKSFVSDEIFDALNKTENSDNLKDMKKIVSKKIILKQIKI